MNFAQWRAKSELLLNQMEHVPYKSAAYFAIKSTLDNHLHSKPLKEDDTQDREWVMSGPAPLDGETDTIWSDVTGQAGETLPAKATPQPHAATQQIAGSLFHHIKPGQLEQLESMFGKKTAFGLVIPPWLVHLRMTAKAPAIERDFESTRPTID
jgi:hypothetical protein